MNDKLTPEAFVYWLQGYVELHGTKPSDQQWEVIKGHLQLCFDKVTPNNDQVQAPISNFVKVPTYDHKEKEHKICSPGFIRRNESGDRRLC